MLASAYRTAAPAPALAAPGSRAPDGDRGRGRGGPQRFDDRRASTGRGGGGKRVCSFASVFFTCCLAKDLAKCRGRGHDRLFLQAAGLAMTVAGVATAGVAGAAAMIGAAMTAIR